MDALTLVLQLFFRSFVVLLPVLIGWLAFRRLTKSTSSNAWIYAVSCLFAAVTTAGLLPWAMGLSASSWVFFVFAAFCPAIWFGVTTICDVSRHTSSGAEIDDSLVVMFKSRSRKLAPLVLDDPVVDVEEIPTPVFHREEPANTDVPVVIDNTKEPTSINEKSVLQVAREMRRNKSTEDRRPKLLPAPTVRELAFIKTTGTA